MERLYLRTRCHLFDRERDIHYHGPGEFDVPDEVVEDYLERAIWKRPDDADESENTFHVLDETLDDLEEALATGAYDDMLAELTAAELAGENRKGAHEAIEARAEELDEAVDLPDTGGDSDADEDDDGERGNDS